MIDVVATRIRAFAADAVSPARRPPGTTNLVAVGWATVDFERAVAELADPLGLDTGRFIEGHGSAVLGARCLIADGSVDGNVALAVMEPSSEGRLAAALARWDEGPLVAWYAANAAPEPEIASRPGPFGLEWLVRGDPLTGPHRLLVAAWTGTIPA